LSAFLHKDLRGLFIGVAWLPAIWYNIFMRIRIVKEFNSDLMMRQGAFAFDLTHFEFFCKNPTGLKPLPHKALNKGGGG